MTGSSYFFDSLLEHVWYQIATRLTPSQSLKIVRVQYLLLRLK